MNRRNFILTALASTTLGTASFAGNGFIEYTPGAVETALAEGKTVFLDFAAAWCSTCARQERVITSLIQQNPDYNQITFISVDWDKYGRSDLAQRLAIPRRSTLVVLKGDQELGRIVAGTQVDKIQELMDIGLKAAMA